MRMFCWYVLRTCPDPSDAAPDAEPRSTSAKATYRVTGLATSQATVLAQSDGVSVLRRRTGMKRNRSAAPSKVYLTLLDVWIDT